MDVYLASEAKKYSTLLFPWMVSSTFTTVKLVARFNSVPEALVSIILLTELSCVYPKFNRDDTTNVGDNKIIRHQW